MDLNTVDQKCLETWQLNADTLFSIHCPVSLIITSFIVSNMILGEWKVHNETEEKATVWGKEMFQSEKGNLGPV